MHQNYRRKQRKHHKYEHGRWISAKAFRRFAWKRVRAKVRALMYDERYEFPKLVPSCWYEQEWH